MAKVPRSYNRVCERCLRKCKQNAQVQLLTCPRFKPKPVQLEIKVPGYGRRFDKRT
ncbi:MAG: hypothetical protein LHW64_07355 [Candidatus Cloacimonetes bacterium]|nr:hypothetical protein [Candidatus Cloacimonadota bacterium]MCB5287605.1 hypothetical protein [Candidatus Cloacimonadota bacterium]MCK9185661.1 hypothetical protein [Candidatus Cloacimonadota bacterium]MCK9584763.1 hypothetical protein [Candidatus Cloacimonadota bacterium]MDY0229927.1 hypothetical protein [Candidatus Cloacimonadaceae bacterium]